MEKQRCQEVVEFKPAWAGIFCLRETGFSKPKFMGEQFKTETQLITLERNFQCGKIRFAFLSNTSFLFI
jgi:hypothetical protein